MILPVQLTCRADHIRSTLTNILEIYPVGDRNTCNRKVICCDDQNADLVAQFVCRVIVYDLILFYTDEEILTSPCQVQPLLLLTAKLLLGAGMWQPTVLGYPSNLVKVMLSIRTSEGIIWLLQFSLNRKTSLRIDKWLCFRYTSSLCLLSSCLLHVSAWCCLRHCRIGQSDDWNLRSISKFRA